MMKSDNDNILLHTCHHEDLPSSRTKAIQKVK